MSVNGDRSARPGDDPHHLPADDPHHLPVHDPPHLPVPATTRTTCP